MIFIGVFRQGGVLRIGLVGTYLFGLPKYIPLNIFHCRAALFPDRAPPTIRHSLSYFGFSGKLLTLACAKLTGSFLGGKLLTLASAKLSGSFLLHLHGLAACNQDPPGTPQL